MPRRRKTLMPDAPLTPVPAEILDSLLHALLQLVVSVS